MSLIRIYRPDSTLPSEFDDEPCLLSFEQWSTRRNERLLEISDQGNGSRDEHDPSEDSVLQRLLAHRKQLRSLFAPPQDLHDRVRRIRQNSACPECASIRVTLIDDSQTLEFLCDCCDHQWISR
jgi:hypothetical protein